MKKADALKVFMRDDNGYYGAYYNFVDELVRDRIQEDIRDMSQPGYDPFETPDNKTKQLAGFYEVLKYYSTGEQYKEFLKELQSD